MPDSLKEEITGFVQMDVRSGFHSPEQIFLSIEATFYEEKLDEKWVKEKIKEEFALQLKRQQNFPAITDFDRLVKAFDRMNSSGIIALHNAGYDRQEGEDETRALHEELKEKNIKTTGYCFYHTQDMERAIQSKGLFLGFGDFGENEKAGTEIGNTIAKILREEGFKIDWDNTVYTRINIPDLKWQKRIGDETWRPERAIHLLSAPR